jgi:hypothetical protein
MSSSHICGRCFLSSQFVRSEPIPFDERATTEGRQTIDPAIAQRRAALLLRVLA